MANIDRPNGFTPAKREDGGEWSGNGRRYEAADRSADGANNHGDIYLGSSVKVTAGKVLPADSGDTAVGVVIAVGTSPTFGEAVTFDTSDLSKQYLGYADSGYVWVLPKAGMLFEIQTSASLSLVEGSTANVTTTAGAAHGSRTAGRSTVELAAGANDVTVVENLKTSDNDITLTNARHLVKLS